MTSKLFQGEVLPYISPSAFCFGLLFSESASLSELRVRRPLTLPPTPCVTSNKPLSLSKPYLSNGKVLTTSQGFFDKQMG